MRISVLIAAYNAAATIRRALASVHAQTHRDWELLVVEDGSHDETEDHVADFARHCTRPVRYENLGRNQGVAAARNRLLRLTAGDAVAFLDADDWWATDHLERALRQLQTGAGLVVTGVQTFDLATGVPLALVRPPDALVSDPVATLFAESVIITSSSVVLTRETLRRTGDFDLSFHVGEDRDYWLRAAVNGARVRIEPEVTCHYAKHPGSTMARTHFVASENVRFYEKHATLAPVPPRVRADHLSAALLVEARLLRASNPRASVRRLLRAWQPGRLNRRLHPHLAFSLWRCLYQARTPRTLFVADRLGGQCGHSGIHQLALHLAESPRVRVLATPDTRARRWIGKAWSLLRRGPRRNQSQSFTELATAWAVSTAPFTAVHFLVGENHTPYLARSSSAQPIIATLHLPASAAPSLPSVGGVHTLVLLSSRNLTFFANAWGARRTVVIPHGVDTGFFHPGDAPLAIPPSILIVGRFLRDFPITASTVAYLAGRHPDWRFDFVVPPDAWHGSDLAKVRSIPGVRWHDRIDDEALRRLYQEATCHLSPFRDCTANNALVESLACGLPVVTSDRGGVRDYGAGHVYPLANDHSVKALAALCERYVAESAWRARISAACRAFALHTLAWPIITRRHHALYAQLARSR